MTAQIDPITEWIELIGSLSAAEQLRLIGLLSITPELRPTLINNTLIHANQNVGAAESWLRTNFRQLLYFYCKHSGDFKFEAATTLLNKAELVKSIAPLILATYSIPLGIAVAFVFWAMNRKLTDWCKKYAIQEFGGNGSYYGSFEAKEIKGFMDITHKPAISEVEDDIEASPLNVKYIRILVPAETTGRIDLKKKGIADEIADLHGRGDKQSILLVDTATTKTLNGPVSRASISRNVTMLNFEISKLSGIS